MKRFRELALVSSVMVLGILISHRENLVPIYLPFFYHESSESFMQLVYLLKALREGGNLFWDTYTNLAVQSAPQTPIFSPMTWVLISLAQLFHLHSMESLATLFALASYSIQILAGVSAYFMLRQLSLSTAASLTGSLLYTSNFFSSYFGINQGLYRASALAVIPLLFLGFYRLFQNPKWNFRLMTLTSATLGLCWLLNGDVKPTMHFVLLFSLMALGLGIHLRGWLKTILSLAFIGVLSIGLAAFHFATVYEIFSEGIRISWNWLVSPYPLHPDNAILGFSQNPVSLILGFFFPHAFFETFKEIAGIGISENFGEVRFSFTLPFVFFAVLGLGLIKKSYLWLFLLLSCLIFILGSSTPAGALIGWISEVCRIRYPTRAAPVFYFFLALLAAHGVHFLQHSSSIPFVKKLRAFALGYLVTLLLSLLLFNLGPHFRKSIPLWLTPIATLTCVAAFLLSLAFFSGRRLRARAWMIPTGGFFVLTLLFAGLIKNSPDRTPHWEFTQNLLGAGLVVFFTFLTNLTSSKNRGFFYLSLGVSLILFVNSERFEIPPLATGPTGSTTLFDPDPELQEVLSQPGYQNYRVYISPRIKRKLGTDLGFVKSVHNYCCSQYKHNFRLAFAPDASLLRLEIARLALAENYNLPGWRLYNTKYIVDEFKEHPEYLPHAPKSYRRLADHVIELLGVQPLFFTQKDNSELKIQEVASGRASVEVNSPLPDRLVFSEVMAKGWRASIDEIAVPITPIYGMLQSIEIPPGTHLVHFDYDVFQSPLAQISLFLGILLWSGVGLFLMSGYLKDHYGFFLIQKISRVSEVA